MYNSKSSNLSPFHQVHRAQRDTSPSHRIQSKHGHNNNKLYTPEQVSRMLKAYIEPKILFLKNQLQEKQHIIAMLNTKLDQNDSKIIKLNNYIQNIVRRQKHLQHFKQKQQQNNNVEVINQILNDKMKQYWEIISGQLQKITISFSQKIQYDSNNFQTRIQQEISKFKSSITQYIQNTRVKNNNYWLKIKQILNKINTKIANVDDSIINLDQKLSKLHQNNTKQSHIFNQLQRSKQIVKKFIQLKKSVNNIYENYQNVLQLQNAFRKNVENLNLKQKDSNLLKFNQNKLSPYKLNRQNYQKNSRNNINQIMQIGQTFPLFHKKQLNNFNYNLNKPSYDHSEDIIDLQYSRDQPIGSSDKILYNANSPVKKSYQEEELKFKNNYFVRQNNKKNNIINGKKAIYINNSPLRTTSGQSSYKQMNPFSSPHQMSSEAFSYMNITNNINQHSRSTSFVNLSFQHRKQMSQSLKQRLNQLIELKNLTKPLIVYVDEINYLKNLQGNYIFDLKGNMFKVNKNDSKILQEKGILKFIDKNNIQQFKKNNNNNNSINKIKQSQI